MNFITELKENVQPDSLILGDCLEVMKYISDASIDAKTT